MTLIIVFLALVLDRFFGYRPELHSMTWLAHYRSWLLHKLPLQGLAAVFILILLPALPLLLVQYMLSDVLFGLLELLLGVTVLFYCLNSAELTEHIEHYLLARNQDQPQQAAKAAATLAGDSALHKRYAESSAVTMAIMYRSVEDIFGVLFWFVLLGPAGAILYKVASHLIKDLQILDRPDLSRAAETVWGLLGWLPSRLTALTFFLAGSFDDALAGWRAGHEISREYSKSNCRVVTITGCGAIRHEVDDAVDAKLETGSDDLQWVHTARHLIFRSVIIWYAVIAVLTLAGAFV